MVDSKENYKFDLGVKGFTLVLIFLLKVVSILQRF